MRSEFPAKIKVAAFKRANGHCDVQGCERPARGNAEGIRVCGMHYQRWAKYGSTSLPEWRQSIDGKCTAPQCDRLVRSGHGAFCETHYYRIRRGSLAGLSVVREVCEQCGTRLTKNQSRFCSKRCDARADHGTPQRKPCAFCGAMFATSGTARMCSDKCRIDATKDLAHRRRAKMRGANAEKFSATEIFERDRWVCQLCGEKTDRKAPASAPFSPSLDHIVPLARGGEHTRRNCQCSHLQCNIRKQGRARGQMRLFG